MSTEYQVPSTVFKELVDTLTKELENEEPTS